MGDSTWVEVHILKAHQEEHREWLLAEGFLPGEHGDEGPLYHHSWNQAADEPLQAMAKRGVTFYGTHGPGGSYGGAQFFAKDGRFEEWEAGHNGEGLVVHPENDGTLDEEELLRPLAVFFTARAAVVWEVIDSWNEENTEVKPA